MQNSKITDFAALIEKSAGHGTLKNVVFHSPRSGDAKKAKGVLKTISGERVLQVEFSLTEGRVTQENVAFDKIPEATERYLEVFGHADLTDRDGTASLMTSKKGAVTLLKKTAVVALNIRDYDSGAVADALYEEFSIATRAGAHCAPRMHMALGTEDRGAVRFSFSWFSEESDVLAAVRALEQIAQE